MESCWIWLYSLKLNNTGLGKIAFFLIESQSRLCAVKSVRDLLFWAPCESLASRDSRYLLGGRGCTEAYLITCASHAITPRRRGDRLYCNYQGSYLYGDGIGSTNKLLERGNVDLVHTSVVQHWTTERFNLACCEQHNSTYLYLTSAIVQVRL